MAMRGDLTMGGGMRKILLGAAGSAAPFARMSGGVALAALLFAAVGAVGKSAPPPENRYAQQDTTTPAPPESVLAQMRVPVGQIRRGGVLAYARGLVFADSMDNHRPPDRFHGQWDLNLLDTLGTMGLVEPEMNIHRDRANTLGWDGGRVQLRITIKPSPQHPGTVVEQDGVMLYPGITYVWVDSMTILGDSGVARALYIPEDSTKPIQHRVLQVLATGPPPWNHAVARWTPAQCWTCEKFGWCH
jgi:hypothetical protein